MVASGIAHKLDEPADRLVFGPYPKFQMESARIVLSVLLLLSFIIATRTDAAPVWRIELHSQSGDFVGQGLDYLLTEQNSSLFNGLLPMAQDQVKDGLVDFVSFSFTAPAPVIFTDLVFQTGFFGTNLVPGLYPDAQRAFFAQAGHPAMDIGLGGRGCNTLTGAFSVSSAAFNYSGPSPQVDRFSASFEQHCEGAEPALLGRIDFSATPVDFRVSGPPTALVLGVGVLGLWLVCISSTGTSLGKTQTVI